MRLSFPTQIFRKSAITRALLGASLLVLSPLISWAQTTTQDFEPTTANLPFRVTNLTGSFPGGLYTRTNDQFGNNTNPSSTVGVNGSRAYGVVNPDNGVSSTRLDFDPVFFSNSANSTISFRLAAFGLGNNQGLTSEGSVVLSLSINGSTVFDPIVTVKGPSVSTPGTGRPAIWTYNNTSASTSLNTPLLTTAPEATGSSTSGGGPGIVSVTLPAGITQVRMRITLTANSNSALLIDNVTVNSFAPLPVELTRFTAEAQEKSVALHWTTASEKNSDYFEVQRSTDAKTFAAIGKLQGEGNTSSMSNYLFTDRHPVAGLAYYRLRQVDLDGTESFSPVASVQWAGKLEASFFPNPSVKTITLTGGNGLVHYRVYSVKGQQMAAGEAETGSTVDVSQVPAGVYLLELVGNGQRSVQRFVRQ